MIAIPHGKMLEQSGGRDHWIGIQSFLTEPEAAQADSLSLWHRPWTGMSGQGVPIVKRTRVTYDTNGIANVCMLQAFYETRRQPGKARLTSSVESNFYRKIVDTQGKVIEGPDPLYDWGHWQIVRGENAGNRFSTILRLETAVSADTDLSGVYGLEDTVNRNSVEIVGFGTAAAQTIWCVGVVTNQGYGDDIIDVTYLLRYSGPYWTWNSKLLVQLGSWVAIEVPTFLEDGVTAVPPRYATVWRPAVIPKRNRQYDHTKTLSQGNQPYTMTPVEPEARQLLLPADYSVLQGMTNW